MTPVPHGKNVTITPIKVALTVMVYITGLGCFHLELAGLFYLFRVTITRWFVTTPYGNFDRGVVFLTTPIMVTTTINGCFNFIFFLCSTKVRPEVLVRSEVAF